MINEKVTVCMLIIMQACHLHERIKYFEMHKQTNKPTFKISYSLRFWLLFKTFFLLTFTVDCLNFNRKANIFIFSCTKRKFDYLVKLILTIRIQLKNTMFMSYSQKPDCGFFFSKQSLP